jgi:hypothetical protein
VFATVLTVVTARSMRNAIAGGRRSRLTQKGRYAQAPAASLFPPLTCREFPRSRPAVAAMLNAPMFFIV